MLEAQSHEHSFFTTFTYEREPHGAKLVKEHISSTIHRLRDRARRLDPPREVRFFAVGEYGDQGGRPHYHAAIFGLAPEHAPLIDSAWHALGDDESGAKPGMLHHGVLTPQSAEYISGYVTKKLTKPDDPRLSGRPPEFAVMSRRPGVGTPSLATLIEALNTSEGALYMARHRDVPAAFMVGTKLLPLGGHIRRLLRLNFFGDHRQPKEAKDQANQKFQQNIWAHLPPMSLSASEAERIEVWFEAQAEARDAYHASLRQKNRKLQSKQSLAQSRKKL